ncbi:MAG: hypothetical protein AVDCRST_MAG78-3297 [uncultured Rubrobacteraceae bacterium]|uniref:Uncharacterized protein n=1 Tax=uncultured Rubrobacteraceae bacterium TaxID=349277 RepID=A0A6J4QNB8_9ACTN|nr:MAG: hypothetical protein AVDCRST_MAG78-3297 [uncultured Rubrobacteraceae bacterium]
MVACSTEQTFRAPPGQHTEGLVWFLLVMPESRTQQRAF